VTAPFDDRGEHFLSRWSRRKRADPDKREAEDRRVGEDLVAEHGGPEQPAESAPLKVPADLPAIETLTPESDFSRFMRPDVPMATRTAAVKKLFADPHFNLMDGLDIYIDDYTKADPIPAAMLRELAQSRMLNLFDDEPEAEANAGDSATGVLPEPEPALVVPGVSVPPSDRLADPVRGDDGSENQAERSATDKQSSHQGEPRRA
jgi:hypothetical protein